MCRATRAEITQLKVVYAKEFATGLYNPDKLGDDLKKETWFNFKRVLVKLWEGSRQEDTKFTPEEAEKDAEEIYKKGEGVGNIE